MSDFLLGSNIIINCQKKPNYKVKCRTCKDLFTHDNIVKVKISIYTYHHYCKTCAMTRPKTRLEKKMEAKC